MTRLLLWALLFWLAYKYLLPALGRLGSPRVPPAAPPDTNPHAHDNAHDMVRCAHCGMFVPKAEAVAGDGAYFCSMPHRQAGKR